MASTALRRTDASPPFAVPETVAARPVNFTARSRADFFDPERLAQWEELARHAAEPNPFFEHWFLLPALDALDPAGQVRLLCLESGSRLLGIIPIHLKPGYYGRPIPHWCSWIHPNCFLGTPLVAQGHVEAFWQAVLAWADGAGGGLFLHLPELPMDSPTFQGLCEAARADVRTGGIVRQYERALLKSELSPQEYFEANVSNKRRKELERRSRRLAEAGELKIERLSGTQDIGAWIEDFLGLERAGWKGEAGSALACSEGTAALFRSTMTAAAERGRLDRLTIRLDGTPIAFLSSLLTNGGMFGFKTTYREDFARYSLGVILQREFLDILSSGDFVWCDSCAAPGPSLIDQLWCDRRQIASVNLAMGGWARRTMFRGLLTAEKGQPLRIDSAQGMKP